MRKGKGYRFTSDELATVLHALHILQEIRDQARNGNKHDWDCLGAERKATGSGFTRAELDANHSCDHFGKDWKPLTDEQIDRLCERLNPIDPDNTANMQP